VGSWRRSVRHSQVPAETLLLVSFLERTTTFMQNRPANLFHDAEPQPGLREAYALEKSPVLRLVVVFFVLCLPLLVVAGKLVHLQAEHGDQYVAGFEEHVAESFRTLETTDGRILLDGTVLAHDVASYRLKLHYRWLEEPVDGVWLRRKARERVPKSEWRDRSRVEAAEQAVLAERQRMWQRLAEQLGLAGDEFVERCRRVQQRVERIVDLVEANRERRDAEAVAELQRERDALARDRGWFESGWQTVKDELTTPPKRARREPIEVTEEFAYHGIADGLTFEQIAGIVTRADLFPGVDYEMVTRRNYPQGPLAAHIVGSRQPVDAEEIEKLGAGSGRDPFAVNTDVAGLAVDAGGSGSAEIRDGLQPGDRVGRSGIEQSYGEQLRGRRGLVRIVKDAEGEIIRREVLRRPLKGADIELSLVKPLQQYAESLLDDALDSKPLLHPATRDRLEREATTDATGTDELASSGDDESREEGEAPKHRPRGGCIVALNVYTGEILCAAAAPRFDLRLLTDYDETMWRAVQSDPRSPMFPRVTQMAIPPGSVFKTLTTIAGLEERVISSNEPIYCRGYFKVPTKHRCYVFRHRGYGHGDMTLTAAISHSCNVYFYNVGERLGPDRLAFWSRRMGFGQPTGIDLPGESSGNVPEPGTAEAIQLARYNAEQVESASRPVWHSGETLNFAIGQSTLAVTPLQIVRLTAAIANGGELVTPHVVRTIRQSGQVNDVAPVASKLRDRIPLRTGTLQHLREGMEQVVARGTGRRVRIDEVTVAGKTGTAETGQGSDHAWFTGFVPADSPQVAFVVVLEHGGSGGAEAGPLAKKLIERMLDERLIAPTEKLLQ
jgi:penicillin-binding protein 2